MTAIKKNIRHVRERIKAAAIRAGREPDSIKLVAVSKRKPVELIRDAVNCGQLIFGENYLQESKEKISILGRNLTWHFIGHLQTNKAKAAAELFQVIETVDRLKLANGLEKHLAALNRTMDVLVQVNVGRELQKGGVLPENAEKLIREISLCSHLKVKGLMAMPPFLVDSEAVRPFFREMRQIGNDLAAKGLLGRHGPLELSMGMTADFEVAIEEGATLVRVGTALFGPRT
ncbi:MAG: YggS family pyridoxal phosphate-dependent enzyme [Thermodesulfobacteriota bacterium]|nr:YggS family pyridoxal phosphate-dependent enzyme [Thermodesulfobacteriota bacterium]